MAIAPCMLVLLYDFYVRKVIEQRQLHRSFFSYSSRNATWAAKPNAYSPPAIGVSAFAPGAAKVARRVQGRGVWVTTAFLSCLNHAFQSIPSGPLGLVGVRSGHGDQVEILGSL
jgi:hypothetical protein